MEDEVLKGKEWEDVGLIPSAKERTKDERVVKSLLNYDGMKVNFSNLTQVRDDLEQLASKLKCKTPEQKKAVSEYLSALQNGEITPENLALSTKKFSLSEDFQRPEDRNLRPWSDIAFMQQGIEDHYGIVAIVDDNSPQKAETVSAPCPTTAPLSMK